MTTMQSQSSNHAATNPDTEPKAMFPLLAEPDHYVRCTWDLRTAHDKRAYWLGLFGEHLPKLLVEAMREAQDAGLDLADAENRRAAAAADFADYLAKLEQDPGQFGKLDILEICYQRERTLRRHGFADPYRLAKSVENAQALDVLPKLLAELDSLDEFQRRRALIEGVFAGNIFDLGATKTVDMFTDERVNFHQTRGLLKDRPWFGDDLDEWLERMDGPAHRAAVLFVDNAGPDVVLGMIPLARFLLSRGTRVILTANPHPSLNDITHAELVELIEAAVEFDPPLASAYANGQLQLVPSGNWAPLIDLAAVSPELAEVCEREPIDLVVLEGMGRAIESNYDAAFTCEVLKIAMLKDQGVCDALGAELFDLVLGFERNA